MSLRALPLLLLAASLTLPSPAQAGITDRLWRYLESKLGLAQKIADPVAVRGGDGRFYPPEEQIIVTLNTSDITGHVDRIDLFQILTDAITQAYPKPRRYLPLAVSNGSAVSRAWENTRLADGSSLFANLAVTQFVLLQDREIDVVERDGRFFARLAWEDQSFEVQVHSDIHGDWQLVEEDAGQGALFDNLRGRFAEGAQIVVLMESGRPLLGRNTRLTDRVIHDFYAKLFRAKTAQLYVGRPLIGTLSGFFFSQFMRKIAPRAITFGFAFLTAYSVSQHYALTLVVPSILGILTGVLMEPLRTVTGKGFLSEIRDGAVASYEHLSDFNYRKQLMLRAELCKSKLMNEPVDESAL